MRLARIAFLLVAAPLALAQGDAGEEHLRAALADLGSEEWAVRERAMERVAAFGPAALPHLEALDRHDDPEVRRRARVLAQRIRLAATNREGIWEALVTAGPWNDSRAFAGATIRFHLDERGERLAWWVVHGSGEPVLSEEELTVVLDGLEVRIGEHLWRYDRRSGDLLDASCAGHRLVPARRRSDPEDRREALRRTPDEETVLAALTDESPGVRALAAYLAGWRRFAAARDPLLELLADADPDVRREAAEALGRVGRPDDRARIEPLLEDGDETVRDHARKALEALGD